MKDDYKKDMLYTNVHRMDRVEEEKQMMQQIT